MNQFQADLGVKKGFAAQQGQALNVALRKVFHNLVFQLLGIGLAIVKVLSGLIVAAWAVKEAAADVDTAADPLAVNKVKGLVIGHVLERVVRSKPLLRLRILR